MKNGYYLSAYIVIGDLAAVYHLPLRHDQNISLWKKDGHQIELIQVWELERYTGIKHHDIAFFNVGQAIAVINLLLSQYDLTIDDMNEVWGCPQLEYHQYEDTGFPLHSIAHLYSGFLCDTDISRNFNVLCMAVDGGPDNVLDSAFRYTQHYTGCLVRCGKLGKIQYVQSPGPLWEEAKNLFHLPEGTLMALASASSSRLYKPYTPNFTIHNMKAIDEIRMYVNELYRLCQAAQPGIDFNGYDSHFTDEENRISMAMKEIHAYSQRIMEENVEALLLNSGVDPRQTYLSITGGFGLNCPTNSSLMNKYGFKGFVSPPCVSDTGLSIGLALYHFWQSDDKMEFHLKHAYYGEEDILNDAVLDCYQPFIASVSHDLTYDRVVEDLLKNPVVWFDGRAEIGPRALGHRSILGNPCSIKTKDQLNAIKQREWWRPVAPIVLSDYLDEWFEYAYESPFMLHIFTIKDDKRTKIPAIAHLDYSSRVQSVSKAGDEHLYQLLTSFYDKTGVPLLCNTSLNDKGEPIINTIYEAMNFALRKGFSVIYINGTRIALCHHDRFKENKPARRPINLSIATPAEVEELKAALNPSGLNENDLCFYYDYRAFLEHIDLKNPVDISKLRRIKKRVEATYKN